MTPSPNDQERKEAKVIVFPLQRKAGDCAEQLAYRRAEITDPEQEIADAHEWARRCRETMEAANQQERAL